MLLSKMLVLKFLRFCRRYCHDATICWVWVFLVVQRMTIQYCNVKIRDQRCLYNPTRVVTIVSGS